MPSLTRRGVNRSVSIRSVRDTSTQMKTLGTEQA